MYLPVFLYCLLQPAGLQADMCELTCTSAWTRFLFFHFPFAKKWSPRHNIASIITTMWLCWWLLRKAIMCLICRLRVHADICSRARPRPSDIHILLWLFSIDSLWVISKLMTCERRGEGRTFGRRHPRWQTDRLIGDESCSQPDYGGQRQN